MNPSGRSKLKLIHEALSRARMPRPQAGPEAYRPARQIAMRALDRVADIETDSGGKFVTAIEGVEQDEGKNLFWLYYVNGKPADKGAAEVKLAAGDVEWWDLHNWKKECVSVPPDAQ